MTHQRPTLTWSNLNYPWELEVCWAGRGGVGVVCWRENRRSDQGSPAGPAGPVQQLCSRSSGSGVPLSPMSRHSGSSGARSQEAGDDSTTDALFLQQKDWKSLTPFFRFLIVVQLGIRSLSYSLRLNVSRRRSLLHLPTLRSL